MAPERLRWWIGRPVARRLVLVFAGALLSLAFPRPEWPWLAWISLTPLFSFALLVPPREAFFDGLLFGLGYFTLLLRWLDYTFQNYSAIPWPLTFLIVLLLSAYLASYVGAVAWAGSRLGRSLGRSPALLVLPFLWVTAELLRAHLLSGFPWGLLGYSQYREIALIQIADVTGVYGVSWLVAAVNAAIAAAVLYGRRGAAFGFGPLVVIFAGVLLYGQARLHEPSRDRLTIAIVQASIEQATKWEPSRQADTVALYEKFTREIAGAGREPAVVIWPETALPLVLRREPEVLKGLTALSRESRAPLLVGSVDQAPGVDGTRLYNSTFLVDAQGIRGKYDKIHLVPFGEYVPLRWALGFITRWAAFISEFDSGERAAVFDLPGAPFGTVICYEGIFPALFRQFVGNGAVWMVNVTNDAWFGTTNGPLQHLAMLPFRAVENRVGIARAANTGVSTLIEPSGRIGARLGLFERGVLVGSLPIRRETTWYTRFGDLFAVASAGLSLAAGLVRRSPSREGA